MRGDIYICFQVSQLGKGSSASVARQCVAKILQVPDRSTYRQL